MAKKQKVVLCRNCNNTMVKGTKICPTCGAKNKKPFYKKWWFILIVFIVVVGLFGLIGGDSEKIDWNDLELGYMLPEPDSNKGKIISDLDTYLGVYIDKISKTEYNDYVVECTEMGYTVESDKNGNNYNAYNEDGYLLGLYYIENSEELHISLDAPEELGNLRWPNSDLAKLIPEPNSKVGKVLRESSDGFYIYVGETSIDDFYIYADKCSEVGFYVDYEKGDKFYRAYDDVGNFISLTYSGNSVVTVEMKRAEEKATVVDIEEPVTEKITITATEEPDSDDKTTTDDEEPVKNDSPALVNGMRPEFKEAMDTYEDFMNEYCEFMEKYVSSDGPDLGLLADYANYMSKYADVVEAFEKWEDDDMNAKETEYYIEVQTRVTKNLLEVAE